MAYRKIPRLELGSANRDDYVWFCHDGRHFYCKTTKLGYVDSVAGVAAPLDDGRFVASITERFDAYHECATLEEARNRVAALVALESSDSKKENDDD